MEAKWKLDMSGNVLSHPLVARAVDSVSLPNASKP